MTIRAAAAVSPEVLVNIYKVTFRVPSISRAFS